jgi:hypothetical protein
MNELMKKPTQMGATVTQLNTGWNKLTTFHAISESSNMSATMLRHCTSLGMNTLPLEDRNVKYVISGGSGMASNDGWANKNVPLSKMLHGY